MTVKLSDRPTDRSYLICRCYQRCSGELCDCVVMTDKDSGKSRGFGFVTYTRSSMVDDAMSNRFVTMTMSSSNAGGGGTSTD